MDARLRVLYVLLIAVGIFFLDGPLLVGGVMALQLALWFTVRLPPRRLVRQVLKLWGFALLIAVSYALTPLDPATDHWVRLDLFGWHPQINTVGLEAGLVMVLRLLAVVLASQVARAGDPRAIAQGLRKLGVPRVASTSVDTVLALFGTTGRRAGGGGGGGRGRGRKERAETAGEDAPGFWRSLGGILKGDVSPLLGRLHHQMRAAEDHARADLGDEGRALARDVGIVAGVALTMLGIKVLKLLPAVPFAPGHKGVLLLPLYVVASRLTASRWGGTATGLTMGTVAFLMGDGRYGVFEIVKHVAPGVLCDLLLPMILAGGRRPGPLFWSLFGLLLAVGRFGTIFAMTLAVQAPGVAYAFLVPGLTIHGVFGFLSGYVCYHMMRALDSLREQPQPPTRAP